MSFEHLPRPIRPIPEDKTDGDTDQLKIFEPENLPISDILRLMTHEKFIFTSLAVMGIGRAVILARLF